MIHVIAHSRAASAPRLRPDSDDDEDSIGDVVNSSWTTAPTRIRRRSAVHSLVQSTHRIEQPAGCRGTSPAWRHEGCARHVSLTSLSLPLHSGEGLCQRVKQQGRVAADDTRLVTPCSLKKAATRAGTTLMQKTGQIERTVDREFAEEEGRYRTCVCSDPRLLNVVLR